MKQKLDDRKVKALPLPATGSKIHYDSTLVGFGVRVTAGGSRAFVLNYFVNGRERRYTIGQYPAWSVAKAREGAAKLRMAIDTGTDPQAEKEKSLSDPTVEELSAHFMSDHVKQKNRASTAELYRLTLESYIKPRIGKLKVDAVKFQDVARVHAEVTRDNGPYAANRAVAVMSRMFSLAIRWGYRPDNPARGIERNQEVKRERFLTPEELARLALALRTYPDEAINEGGLRQDQIKRIRLVRLQSCNVIRFALLTGARIGEVLSATWDQFDREIGVWTKPAANTKQKKKHRVPLSSPAMELIEEIKALQASDEHYLFPGSKPNTHQVECKSAWAKLCKLAALEGVRIHDLRHSYASQLASAGLSLPIIGALLGHTQASTTQRYAHLLDDPLRAATERVGALYKHAQTGAKKAPLRSVK